MSHQEKYISALNRLKSYIEKENFKGYDPYDTLCSPFPFHWFTSWGPVLATQFQKRNPINIRPLLGIRKDYNPKGIGLILEAYCTLKDVFPSENFNKQIDFCFNYLSENSTEGFSGACWGYNFPWATTEKYLPSYEPTAVVTGFVCRALDKYRVQSNSKKAADLIVSAAQFIDKDLKKTTFESGICISYTPVMTDCCYNASLLGAEVLARAYRLSKNESYKKTAIDAVNFVISKQLENGCWNYSMNLKTSEERKQIDFHQGYVIDSIKIIAELLEISDEKWKNSVEKGLRFYKEQQFFKDGRSLWRLPKEFPVEIHNQSQGVITFCESGDIGFASVIADWTVENMQDEEGFFYYRNFKSYKNKLSYMRWSNAWMMLALSKLLFFSHGKRGN